MKTRKDLYKETAEMLRIVSTYKVLLREQIYRFFWYKDTDVVDSVLFNLVRQKRLIVEDDIIALTAEHIGKLDMRVINSIWVLLEFIEDITYHTASDFPETVFFFTEKDAFEIVYAAKGQEKIINAWCAVDGAHRRETDIRRIILIEEYEQIYSFEVPAAGFCVVDAAGTVSYYKLE